MCLRYWFEFEDSHWQAFIFYSDLLSHICFLIGLSGFLIDLLTTCQSQAADIVNVLDLVQD